uniref:Uncharacterized protein n=1 Tax=Rhizophora mucronata TaxID=61149 RepID=A0A2P2NC16_RHIMU
MQEFHATSFPMQTFHALGNHFLCHIITWLLVSLLCK